MGGKKKRKEKAGDVLRMLREKKINKKNKKWTFW